MMNDDMLRNIDYLREKANVSYEEAADLLERYEGNVMRVLVELERQGRVYSQPTVEDAGYTTQNTHQSTANEAKEKATSFINKAFNTHVVIEKKNEDGKKETVANVSAPVAAVFAIAAPWLTVAAAGIAMVTGHNVNIKKEKTEETDKTEEK